MSVPFNPPYSPRLEKDKSQTGPSNLYPRTGSPRPNVSSSHPSNGNLRPGNNRPRFSAGSPRPSNDSQRPYCGSPRSLTPLNYEQRRRSDEDAFRQVAYEAQNPDERQFLQEHTKSRKKPGKESKKKLSAMQRELSDRKRAREKEKVAQEREERVGSGHRRKQRPIAPNRQSSVRRRGTSRRRRYTGPTPGRAGA